MQVCSEIKNLLTVVLASQHSRVNVGKRFAKRLNLKL